MNNFFNEYLLAILLGIIQGITEFLPISSTAHMLLGAKLVTGGKDIGLAISNIIQGGTLVAILLYFAKDIKDTFGHILRLRNPELRNNCIYNIKAWLYQKTNYKGKFASLDILIAQLVVATLPIIVFALAFRKSVENFRENFVAIALFLLIGSILMYWSDMRKHQVEKDQTQIMSLREVLIIGIFQSFAIFPGISRSGATISGALILGRPKKDAVRFSFLLSIPTLFLASVKDFWDVLTTTKLPLFPVIWDSKITAIPLSWSAIALASVVSFGVGWFCLNWILKYLSNKPVRNFVIYRIILAILLIILVRFKIL